MTDEQILQNAEQHVIELFLHGDSRYYEKNGFVAGAHSRDEEIEYLRRKNVEYFQGIEYWKKRANRLNTRRTEQGEQTRELRDELKQLRNPWRDASVEKPPYDTDCDDETSVYVIVRQEQGNVLEAYYDYDNNDWRDREHNWRLQDPTHWMPIPELKKGGEQ